MANRSNAVHVDWINAHLADHGGETEAKRLHAENVEFGRLGGFRVVARRAARRATSAGAAHHGAAAQPPLEEVLTEQQIAREHQLIAHTCRGPGAHAFKCRKVAALSCLFVAWVLGTWTMLRVERKNAPSKIARPGLGLLFLREASSC